MTTVSKHLQRLIDANAPFWAGEAEVFRSYWDSPIRTRETDLLWLSRQCHKEFWDGVSEPFDQLNAALGQIDRGRDRGEVLEIARRVYEELSHYCAFADAYDAIRKEGEPALNPQMLKTQGSWPENAELGRVRAEHTSKHGGLGLRAHYFTEGGYCTLFSEGEKLRGRGGTDDLIADACSKVYVDEFEHMLQGIAGLEEEGLSEADWSLFTELTVEQMKCRIRMRNAQFSYPLSEDRVRESLAGQIEPLPFDYEKARLRAA